MKSAILFNVTVAKKILIFATLVDVFKSARRVFGSLFYENFCVSAETLDPFSRKIFMSNFKVFTAHKLGRFCSGWADTGADIWVDVLG